MRTEQFQAGGVLVEMYYLDGLVDGALVGAGYPVKEYGLRLSKTPSSRRYLVENVKRDVVEGRLTHWKRVGEPRRAWTYRGARRLVNKMAEQHAGS